MHSGERACPCVLGVDWGAFDLGVFVAGCRLYHRQLKLGVCEDEKSIPCSRPDNAWRGDGLVGTTGAVCIHAVWAECVCLQGSLRGGFQEEMSV